MKVKITSPTQVKPPPGNPPGTTIIDNPPPNPAPKTSATPGNTFFKSKKQGLFSKNLLKGK